MPYFLENEAKNLLKLKLSKIITDITDEFVDNLFIVNPDNKYQNMMLDLDEKVKETIKIFDRIYYYDKTDRTKHFYFIDTLFKFPEYDRYGCLIKGLAIDNAISTNQNIGQGNLNLIAPFLGSKVYFSLS